VREGAFEEGAAALTQIKTLYPLTLEQLTNITQRRFDPPPMMMVVDAYMWMMTNRPGAMPA